MKRCCGRRVLFFPCNAKEAFPVGRLAGQLHSPFVSQAEWNSAWKRAQLLWKTAERVRKGCRKCTYLTKDWLLGEGVLTAKTNRTLNCLPVWVLVGLTKAAQYLQSEFLRLELVKVPIKARCCLWNHPFSFTMHQKWNKQNLYSATPAILRPVCGSHVHQATLLQVMHTLNTYGLFGEQNNKWTILWQCSWLIVQNLLTQEDSPLCSSWGFLWLK